MNTENVLFDTGEPVEKLYIFLCFFQFQLISYVFLYFMIDHLSYNHNLGCTCIRR